MVDRQPVIPPLSTQPCSLWGKGAKELPRARRRVHQPQQTQLLLGLYQNPKPETRNPEPGTRNPEPETRNPTPETRNLKSETRDPEPETQRVAQPHLLNLKLESLNPQPRP